MLINLFILLLLTINSHAQSVKVMSYNIRLDTKSDGINQWGNRIEKVSQLIKQHNPDLLGVQEALHNQMMDLKNNLAQYDYVGVGRDDGKEKGEYSAIFYKKDKFEVQEQKRFGYLKLPMCPEAKVGMLRLQGLFLMLY
jgi:endonuclease/exonuclease/phosphatase family metal-dependent hydrolase